MATTYVYYVGSHLIDLTALQGKLVDIEAGGLRGMRTDQPGFEKMCSSLIKAMPDHGAAAGIPQDVYDHFIMCNDTVGEIDTRLTAALKVVEVLTESRAFYVDARQNDVSIMVDAMRSRAQRRKDFSILVPFEELIRYNGQAGEKAAQTRRKNEQMKEEEEAEAMHAGSGDGTGTGTGTVQEPAPPA